VKPQKRKKDSPEAKQLQQILETQKSNKQELARIGELLSKKAKTEESEENVEEGENSPCQIRGEPRSEVSPDQEEKKRGKRRERVSQNSEWSRIKG